ncbi:amino acid kinase family protein [Paraburkholderia caballeronis]|uniref:Amino acid kinase family protein n=1 Tax=Paraburkholderia caballeronis TaxID=416943 RepID=A0A1H7LNL0_9BURK|nr:aspartate kinase [Paraburkholderia caballeronis]PXW28518.1 amino acid kinase family protein [Paraburkholderia caballeronis]PXX03884.1 amino acid kinase family protein [Paraburkholderia caballeronis]RAK04628.1 amino acid kinase family protein [Paraburkholderia caballeronis]TDV39329.1 amino acid kinase family protein [Paraburkholderia caballeronis]SED72100.1 Amino acid kinase family protein [Paraburkholderia caballeronis]
MWVVKIGGSLSHDPSLRLWLTELREVGGGRVVIVPGGGDFADRVRQYQSEWQFDDLAAHNMCLLAMTQYGLMMQGVLPDLVIASSEAKVRRALRDGRVAVWVPTALMRDTPDAMSNWDTTSDSLAAWLSTMLNAERLMVVKSCPIDPDEPLETFAQNGVVDRRFFDYVRDANYVVELIGKDNVELMRDRLLNEPVTQGFVARGGV